MNPNIEYKSDSIRREQVREGQRMAVGGSEEFHPRQSFKPTFKKPSTPKGHEAFLKALETSGTEISLEKVNSGEVIIGTVKHSDKYTITIRVLHPDDTHTNRVVFKHDISEFSALQPRPDDLTIPSGTTVQ